MDGICGKTVLQSMTKKYFNNFNINLVYGRVMNEKYQFPLIYYLPCVPLLFDDKVAFSLFKLTINSFITMSWIRSALLIIVVISFIVSSLSPPPSPPS